MVTETLEFGLGWGGDILNRSSKRSYWKPCHPQTTKVGFWEADIYYLQRSKNTIQQPAASLVKMRPTRRVAHDCRSFKRMLKANRTHTTSMVTQTMAGTSAKIAGAPICGGFNFAFPTIRLSQTDNNVTMSTFATRICIGLWHSSPRDTMKHE